MPVHPCRGDADLLFWSQTPWSDARWDSGLLVGPDGARQVWKVAGDGGVLSVLQS